MFCPPPERSSLLPVAARSLTWLVALRALVELVALLLVALPGSLGAFLLAARGAFAVGLVP